MFLTFQEGRVMGSELKERLLSLLLDRGPEETSLWDRFKEVLHKFKEIIWG